MGGVTLEDIRHEAIRCLRTSDRSTGQIAVGMLAAALDEQAATAIGQALAAEDYVLVADLLEHVIYLQTSESTL